MNIENFTGKAEAYAKGRPGYPKEAIETIFGLAPSGAVFADIGAGTGKFTVKLAERGYSVFAVEPNTDMREQLAITLAPFENAKIMDGTVDAFFTNPTTWEFPNPMSYTRDKWLAYIASQDDNPLPTDPGYDAHIAAINAVFDRDSVDGLLHLDRVTKVYSERIE